MQRFLLQNKYPLPHLQISQTVSIWDLCWQPVICTAVPVLPWFPYSTVYRFSFNALQRLVQRDFTPVLTTLSPCCSQQETSADASCSGRSPSPLRSGLSDSTAHTGSLSPVICWPVCLCSCAQLCETGCGRSPLQMIQPKVTKKRGFNCVGSLVWFGAQIFVRV